MSVREQLTLASGLAVALACSALFPLFATGDWVWPVGGAVLVVVLSGLLGRRLGLPRALQPVLELVVLAGYLCVVFASSAMVDGILPHAATIRALRTLVHSGNADIQHYAAPVPASQGLVLMAAAAVGAVAVLVDLVAVVLDRAAISGLPLLVLLAVPSAVLTKGVGGLPFVLGAIGWMGLLLVEGSERVGRWGTPLRSSLPGARPGGDDSSLGRVGRRIGFAAVGLAIVVPYLVPGLGHRLVSGNGQGTGGGGKGPQTSRTYNPITRLQNELQQSTPSELFIYNTTDANPDYIRMTTLDTYANGQWSASKLEADQNSAQVRKGVPTPEGDDGVQDNLSMTIAINHVDGNLDIHWLPVPFGPTKVDIDAGWLWDSRSQTVFSASETTANVTKYSVTASRATPDRAALESATLTEVPSDIKQSYEKPVVASAYVHRLVASITAGKATEYDKAVAIQDYFKPSNGFVYSLTPSLPQAGQDPLDAFLKGKHGFCQQYATAMGVMLRLAGIPSRVAVGFTPGTLVSQDGKSYYSVTTKQAHAWPEAWFAGTGWVRFEPTPGASGSTVPSYASPVAAVNPLTGPTPGTVATPTAKPIAPLDDHGHLSPYQLDGGSAGATGLAAHHKAGRSYWVYLPVLAAVLLVLPFVLTLVRRRRRGLGLEPAHGLGARVAAGSPPPASEGGRHRRRGSDPLAAWDQVVDDATDVGHVWHRSESPRTGAARLLASHRLPDSAAEPLGRLAAAAERARYAPAGAACADAGLSQDVAAVRSALHGQAPLAVRLRAILFPPSTIRWAIRGIGDTTTDVLNRFDDAISAATRPLRRRAAATR